MEQAKNGCAVIVLLAVVLVVIGKCAGPADDVEPEVELMRPEEDAGPLQPPETDGFDIPAPSDPGASYRILSIKPMPNGHLEVLSRRDGRSGTSFARREIDCGAQTYRYLGEGDTRAEAEKDGPNPGRMSEITGTSASSDVLRAACARGPL